MVCGASEEYAPPLDRHRCADSRLPVKALVPARVHEKGWRSVRFTDFALSPAIQRAVEERDHHTPTPIQEQVIPAVLAGRDVLGIAATGSGKTAAYVLPLLDRLAAHTGLHTLVVVPTRELAYQVEEEIASYGRHLAIRTAVIVGGADMRQQINRIRAGAQIVVG